MIGEMSAIEGLVPSDMIHFLNNWDIYTKKFNEYVQDIVPMVGTGSAYKCYKTTSRSPWPLDDRMMFATCYPYIDFAQDEHMLIVSDHGLESVFETNKTPAELQAIRKLNKVHPHKTVTNCAPKTQNPSLHSEGNQSNFSRTKLSLFLICGPLACIWLLTATS